MTLVQIVNLVLSSLTVVGQITVVISIFALFTRNKKILAFFGNRAILFSFIVALIATCGSLFYSEIAGYTPCKFCWFQRIFMYPQVFLLGYAISKKESVVAASTMLILSGIGAIIAAYHYLLQIGIAPEIPCAAVGISATCSQRFVMNFGYITIPLMAFTAFAMIISFMLAHKFNRQSQNANA